MKNKNVEKNKSKENMNNFFHEMSYELAGDIGAVDNDDMIHNSYLLTKENTDKNKINKNSK